MFSEKALELSKTLKDLTRVKGTGGDMDYFVVFTGKVSYSIKVDFETNYTGVPCSLFARVRLVKPEGVDIFDVADWMYDNFNHKKVATELAGKTIKGRHLKIDTKRVSYIVQSELNLNDYGDLNEDYDAVVKKLRDDMTALGKRIYRSMRVMKEVPAATQKIIHHAMMDFVDIYKPPKPKAKKPVESKGDKVVPITKK